EADLALQRFRASVYRRYNDFVVFHALLLQKFPYRMVPALPPKRMLGADREFIEARRRALKRFINLVARHPPFSEDEVLRLFLCFSGPDVQSKLKESAQCVGDEFLNCKLATRAKDFLPADIQTQFAVSRELIRSIYNSFYKLRDRAERMAARAIDNAADLLIFGKELRQDLCERHEKGVLHKHQRALHKYSLMKRQMSAAVHSHEPESVEQLESRIMEVLGHGDIMGGIVEQENAIQTMELRNHFALFCLHQETQLVHAYLPLTSHILGAFVSSQIQGHKEMSKVWNDLKPKLHCLFSGPASALTPPRSPRDGLSPH
ncbi:Sorting nexin-8, partial [Myotis brandtii]